MLFDIYSIEHGVNNFLALNQWLKLGEIAIWRSKKWKIHSSLEVYCVRVEVKSNILYNCRNKPFLEFQLISIRHPKSIETAWTMSTIGEYGLLQFWRAYQRFSFNFFSSSVHQPAHLKWELKPKDFKKSKALSELLEALTQSKPSFYQLWSLLPHWSLYRENIGNCFEDHTAILEAMTVFRVLVSWERKNKLACPVNCF